MLKIRSSVYKNADQTEGFATFFNTHDLFIVLQSEGTTPEQGQEYANKIGQFVVDNQVKNLSHFDQVISQAVQKYNLPLDLSLAAGLSKENLFYLKTVGDGSVYVRREGEIVKVVDGGKGASGYVKPGDIFIFSAKSFIDSHDLAELHNVMKGEDIDVIVRKLGAEEKPNADLKSLIAFFVQFYEVKSTARQDALQNIQPPIQMESEEYMNGKTKQEEIKGPSFLSLLSARLHPEGQPQKKRVLTLVLVAIIIGILIWSVILGYQRRRDAENEKSISVSKEIIQQKLTQSEDVAFLNLARAQLLISEAKTELDHLKIKVGNRNQNEVSELEKLIATREDTIVKKEDKKADEFFDLTVDSSKAQGTKMGIYKDQLAILNPDAGVIYSLSIDKKSLDKKNATINNSTIIVPYESTILFFNPTEGMFRMTDGKTQKVINADSEWGTVVDFAVYNGNIYMVDAGKKQIYKYTPVEDGGYSAKVSYIKNGTLNASNDSTIAIDSSLYISIGNDISKYAGGAEDSFLTQYPEKSFHINKVLAGKEEEKVYAWDKDKGSIYVLEKSGSYERQVKSQVLQKANDVVVYNGQAYVLVKEKIYKLDLH